MKKSATPAPIAAPVAAIATHRASRYQCAEVRAILVKAAVATKQPVAADKLRATSKPNDAKGVLRYNIIEAVRNSATVGDALAKSVLGKPGSKHDNLPYRIKMVDVGFVIANGFADIVE